MKLCTVWILVCGIHVSCAMFGQTYWKFKEKVAKDRRKYADDVITARNRKHGYKSSPIKEDFIYQPFDHFNAWTKGNDWMMFPQRYLVNEEFWLNVHSPVFLYIGGEWTISENEIDVGQMYDLGVEHNALLLALEHRFYGQSINEAGLQLGDIQYLSTQQALADLEAFVRYIRTEYHIPESTPFITFGCSYAGSMSAWFRLKYPQLVVGAVASSAPVRALDNFEGYNEVVARSLSNKMVGGSPECLAAVRTAFSIIDDMIDKGKLKQLKEDFLSCNDLSLKLDQSQFVSNMANYFMGAAQNNYGRSSISHFCDIMHSTNKPYSNVITLNKDMMSEYNLTCVDNSFENTVDILDDIYVDRDGDNTDRPWQFQLCTQFGFSFTCNRNASCPFSKLMTLDFIGHELCHTIFKIDADDIARNIQFTNDYYGSNHTAQSNIVFVNGDIDPWSNLSILTSQEDYHNYAVLIKGATHCQDTVSPEPSDPQPLVEGRKAIAKYVAQFLQDAYSSASKN